MRFKSLAAVCAALATVTAQAVVIDFETLANGTVVTNQFAPFASFTSEAGGENVAFVFGSGNILCTRPIGGSINCLLDTYIDFTNPVNNLEFDAIEPNFAGIDARFRIFHSGGTSVEDLVGLGGPGNKHVDLSSYLSVTRLEIFDILDDPVNENGIGWDNFSFNVVPEPTSMLACAAGIAALLRRRR